MSEQWDGFHSAVTCRLFGIACSFLRAGNAFFILYKRG
ncbi:hypothetical protein D2M30_2368 [Bacillus amyloliquefaciens]|nr:hypothetical protein D2M30_2368 [Bacillus amyloliquefaciens]